MYVSREVVHMNKIHPSVRKCSIMGSTIVNATAVILISFICPRKQEHTWVLFFPSHFPLWLSSGHLPEPSPGASAGLMGTWEVTVQSTLSRLDLVGQGPAPRLILLQLLSVGELRGIRLESRCRAGCKSDHVTARHKTNDSRMHSGQHPNSSGCPWGLAGSGCSFPLLAHLPSPPPP